MKSSISPLKRHILKQLLVAALLVFVLLVAAFVFTYRSQLIGERSRASLGFNLLLQVALENAMLKRDIPGLAEIVLRMGHQPGIQNVMILNHAGEVRFSALSSLMGLRMPELVPQSGSDPVTDFVVNESGVEVLRSINPVHNKLACAPCHGAVSEHPVNGIVVVEYAAHEIRQQAWQSALAFTLAGLVGFALMALVLWRSLSQRVLGPIALLRRASQAIESGQLSERSHLAGDDELGELGLRFDRMAAALEAQMEGMRNHETYQQEVLDGLPDAVRVIRVRDMSTTLVNQAFCQQIGREKSELVGCPCYTTSHHSAQRCPPTLVVCPLHELREVGDELKATHRHVRADGSVFPAEVHAMLIELGSGEMRERYIVESVRDLGQAVTISHEQRLSELGLLAAGIAHEIQNPLASVRLGIQGLSREARQRSVSQEQVVDYMTLIDQEIDNCIAVTRRLLLLARPPASMLQLVVVNETLSDTLRLLGFDAQTRGIEQRMEMPDEQLRVFADEAEVRMILLNLIQNAHHAMPDGGCLTAGLSRDGHEVVIEITDTGVGMTPELSAQIFDPFFSRRADGVMGTGLGLTIVKSVVGRMDGKVSLQSRPGEGSCFRVRLPLAEDTSERSE